MYVYVYVYVRVCVFGGGGGFEYGEVGKIRKKDCFRVFGSSNAIPSKSDRYECTYGFYVRAGIGH